LKYGYQAAVENQSRMAIRRERNLGRHKYPSDMPMATWDHCAQDHRRRRRWRVHPE